MSENKPIRRKSVLLRLSLWYTALTLLNTGVFWVGAGSNQMRLISEKATMQARAVAADTLRRLQPFAQRLGSEANPAAYAATQGAEIEKLVTAAGKAPVLQNYRILTTAAETLHSWPAAATGKVEAAPGEILEAWKALQLRELKNEYFMGVPDLRKYSIRIYIPLTATGAQDLVLMSSIPMPELKSEILGLVRLGAGMVLLLLLFQGAIGYVIYRTLVMPVKRVSSAVLLLPKGDYHEIESPSRQNDEITALVDSFNSMTRQLKDNRDKMNLELDIARKIQTAILPQELNFGNLSATVHYLPLQEVSGDYYDFLKLSDGSLAVFIGDASGHGVPAALITMMAKVYFASLAEKIGEPGKVLGEMNAQMASYFEGSGLYMTGFYMRIYPDLRVAYCNGMHPEPLLLRADGSVEQLGATAFYVGMMRDVFKEYETQELQLQPGDRIVLYSDGLTEASPEEGVLFTQERLFALLQENRELEGSQLIGKVIQEVRNFTGAAERIDDETMIVIEAGAVSATGKDPRSQWQRAQERLKARDFKGAAEDYAYCAAQNFQAREALFAMAVCLYRSHRFAECVSALRNFIQLEPGSANAHSLLSLAALNAEDGELALQHIETAVQIEPESRRLQTIRGKILELKRP